MPKEWRGEMGASEVRFMQAESFALAVLENLLIAPSHIQSGSQGNTLLPGPPEQGLTPRDVLAFLEQALAERKLNILVAGNLSKENAERIAEAVDSALNCAVMAAQRAMSAEGATRAPGQPEDGLSHGHSRVEVKCAGLTQSQQMLQSKTANTSKSKGIRVAAAEGAGASTSNPQPHFKERRDTAEAGDAAADKALKLDIHSGETIPLASVLPTSAVEGMRQPHCMQRHDHEGCSEESSSMNTTRVSVQAKPAKGAGTRRKGRGKQTRMAHSRPEGGGSQQPAPSWPFPALRVVQIPSGTSFVHRCCWPGTHNNCALMYIQVRGVAMTSLLTVLV
jgi:hypothetical protein